jgi:hypothetical protein
MMADLKDWLIDCGGCSNLPELGDPHASLHAVAQLVALRQPVWQRVIRVSL